MSYDLILWRGAIREAPATIWTRLQDGTEVEGVEPMSADEVRGAFGAVFGSEIRSVADAISGPGFELQVAERNRHLHVTCAWALLKSDAGLAVLSRIDQVGERLRANVHNPQTEETRIDATLGAVRALLARLEPGQVGEREPSTGTDTDTVRVPARHRGFLQLDREPWEREGGLHALLGTCFPVDGCVDQTGLSLEYASYDARPVDGDVLLQVVWRGVSWRSGAIEAAWEQAVELCALTPDGSAHPYPSRRVSLAGTAEQLAEHLGCLIHDCMARAQRRIAHARRDVTPAELVLELGS